MCKVIAERFLEEEEKGSFDRSRINKYMVCQSVFYCTNYLATGQLPPKDDDWMITHLLVDALRNKRQ